MVLQTALNYLSQASSQLVGQSVHHNLIGQSIKVGNELYVVRSLVAEGGFALVFAVQDARSGEWFALKRQLAHDKLAAKSILREIGFMKQLNEHPAIVRFVRSTKLDSKTFQQQDYAEFLIITELCSGGPLIDYLQKIELSVEQICKIFYSTCSAIQHMHDRNPPITHRDIKIENLLFDSRGYIKLCDFGSATTDIYRPKDDWNALMRSQLEEEMSKYTTPMYRAPEILETYQNYPIGPAQDIWALGCILFYLCFKVHPFEDSAKLRIINAKYTLPSHSTFRIFHDLIKITLQPNPYSRPTVQDLCEQVEEVAMELNVHLDEPVLLSDDLNSVIPKEEFLASTQSLYNQSVRFLDRGMNLIKTIKEKAPVTNISEHLKTQLGFDSNQSSDSCHPNREKKMPPPRPPAPVSCFQTKTVQLTYEDPQPMHPKLMTASLRDLPIVTSDDLLIVTSEEKNHTEKRNDMFSEINSEQNNEPSTKTADDILAEFFSTNIVSSDCEAPSTSKPDYSDIHFTKIGVNQVSENMKKTSLNFDAFDDLLAAQGFISTAKQSNKTLSDMAKECDATEMDPVTLKIKDWTDGKQRNIRTLLGSLSHVLWDEAKVSWKQPSVAELFAQDMVKKYYRKACLIVHPDKQVGTINEPLAKAIFTELNDAWNEFTK